MPGARQLLGPDGPLANAIAGYELRRGQIAMAEAVERALEDDGVLLCEAGTGTGKTFAYLVPALLSRRKVVVATASRALQEQIHDKDLPAIRGVLGVSAASSVVKGLGNYLCRRRLSELRSGLVEVGDATRSALPILERWAETTNSGDIAELADLPEDHPLWREVTSSSDTRVGSRCAHHADCHVATMKREAQEAQLLVVNHHVLLADLAMTGDHPGSVLPPYDALVIDEAHKLEDVATSFFGVRVGSGSVARLLADARRALSVGNPSTLKQLERAQKLANALFAAINLALTRDPRNALPASWEGPLLDAYHALDAALEPLEEEAWSVHSNPTGSAVARRLAELRRGLASIAEPQRHRITRVSRAGRGLELSSSPVDVGPMLRERLFGRGHAVVMTSASLATGGSFAFLRSRLGLADGLDTPIDELVVAPDLDHRDQALLYSPTDLPEVHAPDFVPQAVTRIAELLALTPGGAFLLCTSNRAMRALAAALTQQLTTRAVMMQGEAPKAVLLERFRNDGEALLVATMSFWEGVDVPGSALALVMIDRLPFSVPSDPLVIARCDALREAGRDPFLHYSVPRAAITLKQGCGRLLRTRRDRGVLALLDRRVCTKGYGRTLLDSLPEMAHTRDLEDVAAFWRRHVEHDAWQS